MKLTIFLSTLLALSLSAAEEKPISFFNDVVPIFKKSCNGCHHPGKLKGQLDLTTYDAAIKGGKHGALVKAGDPKGSVLMDEITGEEPSMPKEGDPLTKDELAFIENGSLKAPKMTRQPVRNHSSRVNRPPTLCRR